MIQQEKEDEIPLISSSAHPLVATQPSCCVKFYPLLKISFDYIIAAGIGSLIIRYVLYRPIGNLIKTFMANELTTANTSTNIQAIAEVLCSDANNTMGCQRLISGILAHYLPEALPFVRSMPLRWLDWLIVGLSISFMIFLTAGLLIHCFTRATTAGVINIVHCCYRTFDKPATLAITLSTESRNSREDNIHEVIHGPAVL